MAIHGVERIETLSVTFPSGFQAAGVGAGLSAIQGKKGVALVVNDGWRNDAAAVFTTNRFCAAPVLWSRQQVSRGTAQAIVLTSGGANACAEQPGYQETVTTSHFVGEQLSKSLLGQYHQDLLGVFGDPGLVVEKGNGCLLEDASCRAE